MRKENNSATLKRRLAALEKQWETGLSAPHIALELCVKDEMPRHEWPAWIEPAIDIFSITRPAPTGTSHPITGPEQTRVLATMADKLVSRFKVSAPAAARAAIEAMREIGWELDSLAVGRVKREMSKLVKDMTARAITYPFDWDMRALCKLAERGKTRR